MFTKDKLRQAISTIESYYSLDKLVEEEEIASKMGISIDGDEFKTFEEFCSDYDDIRDQKNSEICLTDRQFSDHSFDFYRTLRNGALSAVLGLFSDPQLYSALTMAGAGMAVTAYDENVNKGTMQLGSVWFATALGAFVGHFFGEDQTGKYIGAGIGAMLSTVYEAQQGLRRRVTPNKSKEEVLREIETQYERDVDNLLTHYSS